MISLLAFYTMVILDAYNGFIFTISKIFDVLLICLLIKIILN